MASFEHGGLGIYYEESGRGDPLLLMPGFSGTIATYQPLRARFAERYRVIAADLPGSGRSLPQPRTYGTDYHHRDAEAFAALLQSLGCGPSHLLGHSDGGEVAVVMAEQFPGQARSVMAWGAVGVVSDPDGWVAEAFRNAVDVPFEGMEGYRTYLIDTYGEAKTRAIVRSFADGFEAIIAAGGDISRSSAHQIACPVLLMAGQDDGMCPPSLVRELAALIPGAEVVVAEGAGHIIHDDRPEWFVRTVEDWLARQSAAAA